MKCGKSRIIHFLLHRRHGRRGCFFFGGGEGFENCFAYYLNFLAKQVALERTASVGGIQKLLGNASNLKNKFHFFFLNCVDNLSNSYMRAMDHIVQLFSTSYSNKQKLLHLLIRNKRLYEGKQKLYEEFLVLSGCYFMYSMGTQVILMYNYG